MPPVCMIQDDPAVLAATTSEMPAPLCEWPLPPVIVTEKGESLDEFVARSAPDFFTALQVCQLTTSMPHSMLTSKARAFNCIKLRKVWYWFCMQVMVHVAHKLEQLHEAGWAHRDLKPGNAIWLPSSNSWTLIDFGSAARIGTHPSPTTFSVLEMLFHLNSVFWLQARKASLRSPSNTPHLKPSKPSSARKRTRFAALQ